MINLFASSLIAVLCFFQTAHAQSSLLFSKPGPQSHAADISEQVLIEAYQRIGIDITTLTFPGERALAMSNRGDVDGEVNRIKGLEVKYPNLVMVPVVINWLDGVVVTKRKDLKINGWESLRPYRVGYRIGLKFVEYGTSGMKVTAVPSDKSLFKMLDYGRVDMVVSTRIDSRLMISEKQYSDMMVLEPPLVQLELFHYLHKKNKDLLLRITQALQDMTDEGRIQAIRKAETDKLY